MLSDAYVAGFFDGDGSINISKVGPVGKQGYLLKAEMSQCNHDFLTLINARFGHQGKLYADPRREKYTGETNWCLRFCGKSASAVLAVIQRDGVIKAEQARIALQFLDLPRVGSSSQKERLRLIMKDLNRDKTAYDKPWNRINAPWIAGLFDAEGNAYVSTDASNKTRMYVKITQKSDPDVLHRIRDYFGFGTVTEVYRWKIYSASNIAVFHRATAEYARVKAPDMQRLINVIGARTHVSRRSTPTT